MNLNVFPMLLSCNILLVFPYFDVVPSDALFLEQKGKTYSR